MGSDARVRIDTPLLADSCCGYKDDTSAKRGQLAQTDMAEGFGKESWYGTPSVRASIICSSTADEDRLKTQ